MEAIVDLYFNFGGAWINKNGKLEYNGGDVDILPNFDPDYLCYADIKDRYAKHLGFATVKNIFVLEPGKELTDGLFLIDDDASIRNVLYHIFQVSWVSDLQFYANHDVDRPIFEEIQLAIEGSNYENSYIEIVEPNIEIGTQFSFVNASGTEGESHKETVGPAGYVSEEKDNEDCEGEGDSEDSSNNEDADLEDGDRMRVSYDEIDELPHFMLGMTFIDAKEARLAISKYAVARGVKLKLHPNEPYRIRAKCTNEEGCPFYLFISKDGRNQGLAVKTLRYEHRCFREFKIPQASATFLAKHYKEKIYRNPNYRIKDMKDDAELTLRLHVTFQKCKRAKKMVIQELNGSYKGEFRYLEAYAEALKRSNPGTKAEIELCKESLKEGRRVFKRIFIIFDACKKGWKLGCRPVIGLDGCFLKGFCKGQLLAAIGTDADGRMFPIAWAVIDKENKDNWRWFICWLTQELELGDGSTLTIISDMQKGLIDAVKRVLPFAEHRWCARHIHANWCKKWRGGVLKNKFWICSWSTYDELFKDNLKKLGEISKKAAEDLMKYPAHTWCRAYFSSRAKSESVDNNISECFNSWIKDARHKPIISMLDGIRTQTMNLIKDNKLLVDRWFNDWSPSCMERYQDNKENSAGCKVIFNGDDGFEIGEGEDRHTVFLDRHLCTCRSWDLTGIPCEHAICALHHKKMDPMQMISPWYHKKTYLASYQFPLLPVPGKRFMRCDEYLPIEPPPITKMTGRPRKKRIRGTNELNPTSKIGKLSKKGVLQTCGNCMEEGHNKKLCKNKSNQVVASEVQGSTQIQRSKTRGYGAYVDLNTGQTTLNPGMASETIVIPSEDVSQPSIGNDADAQTRYPIPNERQLRNKHKHRTLPSVTATRKVQFVGEGSEVTYATDLPFTAPGLQWMGSPSTTSIQLQREKHQCIERQKRKAEATAKNILSGQFGP